MSTKIKPTIYVVSNMYPSNAYPNYGIFVKRFILLISAHFNAVPITIEKKTGFFVKVGAYTKLYLRILKLLFKKNKTAFVYVHFPLYVAPILLPLVWFQRRIILNFHGSDIVLDSWYKKILGFFLKTVVPHSRIVVPSAYYKHEVQKAMGIEEQEILVYPSGGVNQNMFYPKKKAGNKFVLGFVSNFIHGKGWKVFLDSVEYLMKGQDIGPFQGIMVGQGKDKTTIIEAIKKRNLPVKVYSNVPQEELVDIYALFDLFIFPSYRKEESLGLVGIEAMTCGIPVIASKTGGPMGYVKEGENGYLFELKDSKGLSERIIKYFMLSQDDKRRMKGNCLKTAKEFESKLVTQRLLDFLGIKLAETKKLQ